MVHRVTFVVALFVYGAALVSAQHPASNGSTTQWPRHTTTSKHWVSTHHALPTTFQPPHRLPPLFKVVIPLAVGLLVVLIDVCFYGYENFFNQDSKEGPEIQSNSILCNLEEADYIYSVNFKVGKFIGNKELPKYVDFEIVDKKGEVVGQPVR